MLQDVDLHSVAGTGPLRRVLPGLKYSGTDLSGLLQVKFPRIAVLGKCADAQHQCKSGE